MVEGQIFSEMIHIAILLNIEELRKKPMSEKQLTDFMSSEDFKNLSRELAEKGDYLLVPNRGDKGVCASLFNRIAKTVAVLSFLSFGFPFYGKIYKCEHTDTCRLMKPTQYAAGPEPCCKIKLTIKNDKIENETKTESEYVKETTARIEDINAQDGRQLSLFR